MRIERFFYEGSSSCEISHSTFNCQFSATLSSESLIVSVSNDAGVKIGASESEVGSVLGVVHSKVDLIG